MTATAKWREAEFKEVYGIRVIVIPPCKPVQRKDYPDMVFQSKQGLLHGIMQEVAEIHPTGRPILIGTATIEEAEEISQILTKMGISHQVLHAKYHDREAQIIAAAGQRGAVTISARMAGRGTDIILGESVDQLGGLHVIGVERNESRHIDMQLIGRAGRQGLPGSSRFFVTLESDLMRRFVGQRVANLMEKFGAVDDIPMEAGIMTASIKNAQRRVEGHNFELRRKIEEYDSVLDKQRQFIYTFRRKAILEEDLSADIDVIMENVVMRAMERYLPEKQRAAEWDIDGLSRFFCEIANTFRPGSFMGLKNYTRNDIKEWLINNLRTVLSKQYDIGGVENMAKFARETVIRQLDQGWVSHLYYLKLLNQEMNLRQHMEESPLEWFTRKSNIAFWEMIEQVEINLLKQLLNINFRGKDETNELAKV